MYKAIRSRLTGTLFPHNHHNYGKLGKREVDLITESWRFLSTDPEIISKFYDKLFEMAPYTRYLFPEELTQQNEKVKQALNFIVQHLKRLETIVKPVEELGNKHRRMNIRYKEYFYLKTALITTIEQKLPEKENCLTLLAWDKAITMIVFMMTSTPE